MRWPKICEGVYARLESMFRDKLSPTDLFVRIEDNAYLVVMPSAEPEDVHVVCLRIAYDLYTTFLGSCDMSKIRVSSAQHGGDNTLVLKELSITQIATLAEKAGIEEFTKIARASGLIGGSTAPGAPRGYGLEEPVNRTVLNPDGIVALEKIAGTALSIDHEFVPVWDIPNKAVTTYICRPRIILQSGRHDPIKTFQLTPKEHLNVELSCLHAGVSQLARSITQRRKFLLGVSLPFPLLQTSMGRMEILSACRALSSEYRDYISFHVTEVPPGVAQTTLGNLVNTVRPFARAVSATVAPHARVLGAYQGIGLRAIGFDLAEFSLHGRLHQQEIEQLAHFARQNSLLTFLFSVHNRNTLRIAQDNNVQFLSGSEITPPMEEPRGMWRLTWDKFMPQSAIDMWD